MKMPMKNIIFKLQPYTVKTNIVIVVLKCPRNYHKAHYFVWKRAQFEEGSFPRVTPSKTHLTEEKLHGVRCM